MADLTIELLEKICTKLPKDFTVEFIENGVSYQFSDSFEINVSDGKLILKV